MQARINEYFDYLGSLPLRTETGMGLHEAFRKAIDMFQNAGRVYFIGNGGSMATSMHMAEDYTKIGGIPSQAFSDAALLTCFANDYGYEHALAKAVQFFSVPGDILVAISSSGKSANIINAVNTARKYGCDVITFTGFDPGNPLRKLGDLNFYVPDGNYDHVENVHQSLLTAILRMMSDE